MGKLIAIEGVDASGKQTQTERLYQYLTGRGRSVKRLSFPCYDSPSSTLCKMYLAGDFGRDADEVSPYIASTFFAADRYASYKTDWQRDYSSPERVILADRYTPSNMIHQAAKLESDGEKERFIRWLEEYEYEMYGLPRPDMVLFLHMPFDAICEIIAQRDNKITNQSAHDIHEGNRDYLKRAYDNALYVARAQGFCVVECAGADGAIRTIEDIAEEIARKVEGVLA